MHTYTDTMANVRLGESLTGGSRRFSSVAAFDGGMNARQSKFKRVQGSKTIRSNHRVGKLYLKSIVVGDEEGKRWTITIKDMNTQKFLC